MKFRRIIFLFCFVVFAVPAAWSSGGNEKDIPTDPEFTSELAGNRGGLWKEVSRFSNSAIESKKKKSNPKRKLPRKYRMLELNVKALEALLRRAPYEDARGRKNGVELTLPMGDGVFQSFRIYQTDMMEPELSAKFPELKTYTGVGIDNPTASLRISWTPRGIEIIVLGTGKGFFIEPFEPGSGSSNYISYESDALDGFSCEELTPPTSDSTLESRSKHIESNLQADSGMALEDVSSGSNWRTYRLAITTSQEYYTNNGGTDVLVMAAITNKVNQLNAIYERELAVRFTLIGENDLLLDQSTFSDTGVNIGWSSPNVTSVIDGLLSGTGAVYDLGHLFLYGYGGGVAYVSAVCRSNNRADGQSGVNARVDVVAHEIGHQFSMRHTWNACGAIPDSNRTGSSAYEPGAGTTLMSYAGSCGSNNLLGDFMQFHVHSYEQADDFIAGSGSCNGLVATGNTPPSADSGTASITIPADTPFALEGSATDLDGDTLSYSWEGMNLGPEAPPGGGTAPFFKVFEPTASPQRVFPQISDILNGTTTQGEELPGSSQTLNFRLHVYDGLGGVSYPEPNTQVIVDGSAGPFQVTSPNAGGISWIPGDPETVTWNVAVTGNGTTVDCENVAIDLSVDGGYTYPVPLESSTPNDGSQSITVPGVISGASRVRVRCAEFPDHFFFDISDNNLAIGPTPGTGECPANSNVVNSLADTIASDNQCTLREAVSNVSPGGTITFDAALTNGVIALGSQITIDKSMTIDGGGSAITVSGDNATRIFYIYSSSSTPTVVLRDFTLTEGFSADSGGAIYTVFEDVTLERMVISNSEADNGGAIYHRGATWGPLTITDSTFIANRGEFLGGAIRLGGNSGAPTTITGSTFVDNEAWRYSNSSGGAIGTWNVNLTIVNSTFTDNSSTGYGGAIGDYTSATSSVYTIRNSTLYDNDYSYGAGANIFHDSPSGELHISNSILGGTAGDDCVSPRSPLDTNVNNLIQDGSCSSAFSGDPLLDVLADNGGYTKTMALLAGSPALGAGTGCELLDQRDYTRKAACDLGAYEMVSCGAGSYDVPFDEWHVISLPCDPGANNTVGDILGDDLSGVYGSDWGLYRWNPASGTQGTYSFLSESSTLIPGFGYWLLHLIDPGVGSPESWSMETTDDINTEPFDIALTAAHDGHSSQQNLVGNPTERTFAWEDMLVVDSYGICYGSPSVASTVGSHGLIEKAINIYNGSGYTACDDTGTNPPCTIDAGDGFWVEVPDNGESNLRLRMGGSCGSGSALTAKTLAKVEASKIPAPQAEGWAVQLKVNAGPYEDPVNTLGQRETAEMGYDLNDLEELAPDRTPYMTLVFPHADWGEQSGDYGADYHPLDNVGEHEWSFVVYTSENLDDLTISWQGPTDILKYSELVDEDTGKKIKLKKIHSYSTGWNGLKERHFKWVLKKSRRNNDRLQ